MNFNVDRIAVLAGLAGAGKSGLMKEGVAPVAATPAAKPLAPSAPAKVAPVKAAPLAAPKPPAASPKMEEVYEEDMYEEGMYEEEPVDEMYADTMGSMGTMGGMGYDDMVYEVDETELMEALVDMREKRLEESKVRSAVRKELSSILNSKESGSRWLYGNRQPTSSSNGNVSRGFLGPGFR
jgi:hypothetical protein